ncbi:hypothetical protein [Streptomyces sp. CB01881]|uniref:hypothetical protein n=1 Tax=Streptomyces sp. CB01881 TaxID=2078691 RepID=UPI00129C88BB|nr:hypothetical protein [Streptomyces sp. CB01881]
MRVTPDGTRRAGAALGVLVLLGGGLAGWHAYLDAAADHPPAVSLSHGECRGALADERIGRLLGAARTVRVESDYRPAEAGRPPRLRCFAAGQGEHALSFEVEAARSAEERADAAARALPKGARRFDGGGADHRTGVLRFDCAVKAPETGEERTAYYLATVKAGLRDRPPATGPGEETMAELAVVLGRQAAEQVLGCTGPVDWPATPVRSA